MSDSGWLTLDGFSSATLVVERCFRFPQSKLLPHATHASLTAASFLFICITRTSVYSSQTDKLTS